MPPRRGVLNADEPLEDAQLAAALRESLALGEGPVLWSLILVLIRLRCLLSGGGDISDADLKAAMEASLAETQVINEDPIWRTPRGTPVPGQAEGLGATMVCPITNTPMVDPVSLSDGQIYERHAIEDFLEFNDISPVTGEPLKSKMLSPVKLS